ncbi:MAG: hypothetical protein ACR2GO_04095 [Candidatus Limnocylindria bacterium]
MHASCSAPQPWTGSSWTCARTPEENDVRWVALDALPVPMRVGVGTRYWQFATVDDPRLTIKPDVEVPVAAADFFGGIDAALDAALAHER